MHSQNLQSLHEYFEAITALKECGEEISLSLPFLQRLTDLFGDVAEDARCLEQAAVKPPFIPDRRGAVELIPSTSNVVVFRPRKQENTDDLVS